MVKVRKQKVRFRKKNRRLSQGRSSLHIKAVGRFLVTLLLLGVIGAGLARLKYMFVDSDYFMVKEINIQLYDDKGASRESSLQDIDDGQIIGASIFLIDLKDLKEKIEAQHPEFKDVVVRRVLPDKLLVGGTLRKVLAQIRSDRYYFVDEDGILLPDIKNFPDKDLPIITGIGINLAKVQNANLNKFEKDRLKKALGLIKEIDSVEGLQEFNLKVVDITDPGNLSFWFEAVNVEVKIGNADFGARLKVLATVFDQIGSDSDKFKYIDLRFEDPIIGPR